MSYLPAMMMLTLLLVTVCLLVDGELTKDEGAEREIFKKCSKNVSIPESALEGFFNMENIETLKDNQCVVKCILDENAIIKEDGTIDVDNFGSSIWKNFEDQNKIIDIAKDCSERVKKLEDLCEFSYDFMECVINGMKKMTADTEIPAEDEGGST